MSFDLRISLQKLDVLARVVRLGGVGRAAEDLYVVQPAVTAQIRSLEQRTGVELFRRQGRRMGLTPEGEALYLWAEEVLERTRSCEAHLDELLSGAAGRARIGADLSTGLYVLSPVLAAFRAGRDRAEIELSVADADRLLQDVRAGTLDLAVIAGHRGAPPADLEVERIGSDELVLVASGEVRRAAAALAVAELASLPFVDAPGGLLPFEHPHVTLRTADPEARKHAVLEGEGLTLLSRAAVASELRSGLLRAIAVTDLDLELPVTLVRRADSTLTPLQRQLVEDITVAVRVPQRLRRAAPDEPVEVLAPSRAEAPDQSCSANRP